MTTGAWIYRAMVEDDGKPKLGPTALTLGIRPGYDIEMDGNEMVHRPGFEPGEKNGLSCAPAVGCLPPFALPVSLGGFSKKAKVWKISHDKLDDNLEAQQDAADHISIGPARSMFLAEYVAAIERSVSYLVKVK